MENLVSDNKKNIVEKTVDELKNMFGDKLKKVILYGSYARGDFNEYSDIDIMALADIEREKIPQYNRQVRRFSNDISLDNDVIVSIMLDSADFFFDKLDVSRFYKNVIRDGRVLYG